MAALHEDDQLLEEAGDGLGVLALDGDLVAPDPDLGLREGGLDEPQELVALAEEADHQVVAGDVDLHGGHVFSDRAYRPLSRGLGGF